MTAAELLRAQLEEHNIEVILHSDPSASPSPIWCPVRLKNLRLTFQRKKMFASLARSAAGSACYVAELVILR